MFRELPVYYMQPTVVAALSYTEAVVSFDECGNQFNVAGGILFYVIGTSAMQSGCNSTGSSCNCPLTDKAL